MPKAADYTLAWSPQLGGYELYALDGAQPPLRGDSPAWFAWLDGHGAFAFQGRSGRLSLLKEARRGGAGYWYAYRRQGARTRKRYAGRVADLTCARLEALAGELAAPTAAVTQLPAARDSLAPPLLAPKLQPPRLPPDLVARERLLALLDAGIARKFTLLCAPAGCGKTTLARQWLSRNAERRTMNDEEPEAAAQRSAFSAQRLQAAWLSLDPGDNDPIRFWRYVIAVCAPFQADRGAEALALLAAAAQPLFEPLSLEPVLAAFLNALTRDARAGALVLEDYHLITSPAIHRTVDFFLQHLPASLRLVILTRSEPPLPLARLRARGELCEVGAAELRFSTEETSRFFQQTLALALSPAASRQLDDRLEGWAAGLRLLALALQSHGSPPPVEAMLATLAGSHRSILEYFVAEVLSVQPAPTQDFLLRTSALSRLNGSLCAAVTGRRDSAQLLAALARANLFLEPLDERGQWYRYHALFADAMLHEARRRFGDGALRAIAGAASAWYEQHDMLREAVDAAIQAQDWERAAALIERMIQTPRFAFGIQRFTQLHEAHTLRCWIEQLPEHRLRQHPLLCLSYATALLLLFFTERVTPALDALIAPWLDAAEAGLRAAGDTARLGEVAAFRALLCRHRGEGAAAVDYARQALEWLPADELAWRALCLSTLGAGEAFAGRYNRAATLFLAAHSLVAPIGNRTFLRAHMGMLSGACVEQGLLHQAAEQYRRMLIEAREDGDRDDIGHALLGLATLAYEWNDLQAAEQHAHEAFALGEQLANELFQVQATILLARVQQARGHSAPAQQRLAVMLARLQPHQSPLLGRLHRELLAWQARLALAAGDTAAAQRWADRRAGDDTLSCVEREAELLLLARLLIARAGAAAACDLIIPLLAAAEAEGRVRVALELRAALALAWYAQDQRQQARHYLRAALAAAQSERYMRLFLDEGQPMAELLEQTLDRRAPGDPLRSYVELFVIIGTIDILMQGLLSGQLLRLFGEAALTIAGLVCASAAFVLLGALALVAAPALVYAGVTLFAISSGLIEPALRGLISQAAGAREQGLVQGSGQSIQSLALVLGPLWGAALYIRLGHASPYWSGAAIFALGALTTLVAVSAGRLAPDQGLEIRDWGGIPISNL